MSSGFLLSQPGSLTDWSAACTLSVRPAVCSKKGVCFCQRDRQFRTMARKNAIQWRRKPHYKLSEEWGTSILLLGCQRLLLHAHSCHHVSEGWRDPWYSHSLFNCRVRGMGWAITPHFNPPHATVYFIRVRTSKSRGSQFLSKDINLPVTSLMLMPLLHRLLDF